MSAEVFPYFQDLLQETITTSRAFSTQLPTDVTKMAQSGNILEKKWQQMTYEKHRRRLKETKSTLKGETTLQFNDEEAQMQMRFRRIMAEEQRQAVIEKQNHKLLQRIVDIMTPKKKRFPVTSTNETKRKVSGPVQAADSSTAKPRQSTVKLPAINGSSSASGSKS